MVEGSDRAVVAGVSAFVVAEAALLGFSRYKFGTAWALIEMTPGAMVVGCLAGYAFYVGRSDKASEIAQNRITLANVTIEELDRVEAIMQANMQDVLDQLAEHEFGARMDKDVFLDLVRGGESRVEDEDRVAFTCMVARTFCRWMEKEHVPTKENCVLSCSALKGLEIMLDKGWVNDPIWIGSESSPRGKLLATVVPGIPTVREVSRGMDPSLKDCEGKTGFSTLLPGNAKCIEPAFIQFGDQQRVIGWLSTLPAEERLSSFLPLAQEARRSEVAAWLEENGNG